MTFTLDNDGCQITSRGCCRTTALKLSVFDWLSDLPETLSESDLVEVQFKNTRKGYYLNADHLPLAKGDMVVVEASPGHDLGEVTLTGKLVVMQILKNRIDLSRYEVRKVYRQAKDTDLERANEAHAKEQDTMIRARKISKDMQLDMKIGDVEYQGDGSKAIFYYIADERVDFRQLIKVFAETFRVRIEMKQIGARQEAGRIGGTGPCGRELCCTTWLTNFTSVATTAARVQDLSLNPQKLAGQCAKLKCCLNFELDCYQDALRRFPDKNTTLETQDGTWYHFKSNPLADEVTYSSDPKVPANLVVISSKQATDIIEQNKRGVKPATLGGKATSADTVKTFDYENVVGQDDLTRFDRPGRQKRRGGQQQGGRRDGGQQRNFKGNRSNDNKK